MPPAPAKMGSTTPRPAYLVLGMHRSGTSAATQLIALAGAHLPARLIEGDEHNAKGYFEPWRIAVFNDERLRAAGSAWHDPFVHPYLAAGDAAEDAAWRDRARALFLEEYEGAAIPLLKDPRVSVLAPLWRPVLEDLGYELRCVIPVRHPLAVAGSLAKRDGFPVEKSVLLWVAYMLAAEAGSRGLKRVFIDYDALLADWRGQAARIEAAHGAPLPALTAEAAAEIDAFLTPELRRNAGEDGLAAVPISGALAQSVFSAFQIAAAGAPLDARALDAATARMLELRAQMGPLVSPVTRDLDQARSDLADARRLHAFQMAQAQAQMSEALDTLLAAR